MAHCHISFKFTGGMIANSRVESVNACLKHLIYSSNTSLCDLMIEIHRLLDMQDQREQYTFWKLVIPYIKNQDKANFLFQQVDKCLKSSLLLLCFKDNMMKLTKLLFIILQL